MRKVAVVSSTTHGRSRFRVDEPLPTVLNLYEVGAILGYGRTRTWQLQRAGQFDRWELLPRLDGTLLKFSGKQLQAYLDGEGALALAPVSRYFGSARRR